MEKLEHDIDNYKNQTVVIDDYSFKYTMPAFGLLIILMMGSTFFSMSRNFSMFEFQILFGVCTISGLSLLFFSYYKIDVLKNKLENEKDNFIDELKRSLITEDFIKAYETTIDRLKGQDQSQHLNRIMFEKSKEYFDKFIVDISKQEKKDWDYFYCLYKHFYFYKHLKDHASFKKLNEKRFEPICYDSY